MAKNKILIYLLILAISSTCALCSKNKTRSLKDVCADYPSCKLISEQMFESYCSRSTLKNMCPSHCDVRCKNSSSEALVKSLEISSTEEDYADEENTTETIPTTTSTTTRKQTKATKKS